MNLSAEITAPNSALRYENLPELFPGGSSFIICISRPSNLYGILHFTFLILGGSEFCEPNKTTITLNSVLTFTLCRNPPPVVTWGFTADEMKWSTTSVPGSKREWYKRDYLINYANESCGKKLYFKADGHRNKPIIWSPETDIDCDLFWD